MVDIDGTWLSPVEGQDPTARMGGHEVIQQKRTSLVLLRREFFHREISKRDIYRVTKLVVWFTGGWSFW